MDIALRDIVDSQLCTHYTNFDVSEMQIRCGGDPFLDIRPDDLGNS